MPEQTYTGQILKGAKLHDAQGEMFKRLQEKQSELRKQPVQNVIMDGVAGKYPVGKELLFILPPAILKSKLTDLSRNKFFPAPVGPSKDELSEVCRDRDCGDALGYVLSTNLSGDGTVSLRVRSRDKTFKDGEIQPEVKILGTQKLPEKEDGRTVIILTNFEIIGFAVGGKPIAEGAVSTGIADAKKEEQPPTPEEREKREVANRKEAEKAEKKVAQKAANKESANKE